MGLAAWPMARMAGVLMAFVDHVEPLRREGFRQSFGDAITGCHVIALPVGMRGRQRRKNAGDGAKYVGPGAQSLLSSLEGACASPA
jgi:hypothetical protein